MTGLGRTIEITSIDSTKTGTNIPIILPVHNISYAYNSLTFLNHK